MLDFYAYRKSCKVSSMMPPEGKAPLAFTDEDKDSDSDVICIEDDDSSRSGGGQETSSTKKKESKNGYV